MLVCCDLTLGKVVKSQLSSSLRLFKVASDVLEHILASIMASRRGSLPDEFVQINKNWKTGHMRAHSRERGSCKWGWKLTHIDMRTNRNNEVTVGLCLFMYPNPLEKSLAPFRLIFIFFDFAAANTGCMHRGVSNREIAFFSFVSLEHSLNLTNFRRKIILAKHVFILHRRVRNIRTWPQCVRLKMRHTCSDRMHRFRPHLTPNLPWSQKWSPTSANWTYKINNYQVCQVIMSQANPKSLIPSPVQVLGL